MSVLISNKDDVILLDAPSSTGEILNRDRIFHITPVLFSRKHFDHIGGVTFFEYWPEKLTVHGSMYALGNFEITDALYNNCRFDVMHDGETVQVNKIRITPFSFKHNVHTFGFIFRGDDKTFIHFSDKADSVLPDYERILLKNAQVTTFHTGAYEGELDHIDVVSCSSDCLRISIDSFCYYAHRPKYFCTC